jgi:glutathione S-transferase
MLDRPPASPQTLGYGTLDDVVRTLKAALQPGPFLLGDQFTAADVVIGSNIRWGTVFKLIPERKEFADYIARIAARPAAQRAEAKDKALSGQ